MKKYLFIIAIFFLALIIRFTLENPAIDQAEQQIEQTVAQNDRLRSASEELPPMAIASLRSETYPGGDFRIKEQLSNGTNYERYIASYTSEGLTINGLLTIPTIPKPDDGFPAILFIHGYIPPEIYSTVNSYPTYQAYLARAGFITYKPDLRGHDESEGEPVSAHFSEKYVIDTLNALAHLTQYPEVDPERIGYWGHSNGGEIGLRTILATQDIQAASFWAGVVGSYEHLFETYVEQIPFLEQENPLTEAWGLPSQENPNWKLIEPYEYLENISIPIELQHGTADDSVPVELSRELQSALEEAGVESTLIEYDGDDHNISQNASRAWQRTINFYLEHL